MFPLRFIRRFSTSNLPSSRFPPSGKKRQKSIESNRQNDDILDAFHSTDTYRRDIYEQYGRNWRDSIAEEEKIVEIKEETGKTVDLNVSRTKPYHRMLANGRIPPVDQMWQMDKVFLKCRFVKYGKSSGVNPGLLWPTKLEIDEKMALDKDMEPTFKQSIFTVKKEMEEKRKKYNDRLAEIEENIATYPEILADFEKQQETKEQELSEQEVNLQKRIREIQEYFGYWIDPKDPRFQMMLEQKEAEEKKAEKRAKKAEMLKRRTSTVID